MTDRDELIEQAASVVYDAVRQQGGVKLGTAMATAVRALIDAGWRPPPSGDVVEAAKVAALEGVHREDCFDGDDEDHGDCKLLAGHVADAIADAGLLRTPPQERTEFVDD